MTAMNTRQAAVVDVILSNHARGYTNGEMIAHRVAPVVDVPARNMSLLKFGKEGFRKLNTRRAPGAPMLTVQYGYAADPIALVQDTLQGLVPMEISEAAKIAAPGLNLGQHAVQMVLQQLDLGYEIETASIVMNPAGYAASNKIALAGSDKWTDPASDPKKDVGDAKEAIRKRIGRYPNQMTIGAAGARALCDHPKIAEHYKYTSGESITIQMVARYLQLDEIHVGTAIYLPDGATDDTPGVDVWGNDAVLSYASKEGNWLVPSFAYTYRLLGYPSVEAPYYSRERRSWLYPTVMERRPYVVGADAGFLFQGVA